MAINVLIVDDSATMRGFIKRTLTSTQLSLGDLYEASNGLEGLALMEAHWVDLVLADLNMPDMTGVEMINQMSKNQVLAALPVVVISSEGDQAVLDSLSRKGVLEFIRKPFRTSLLQEVVERVLSTSP